MSLADEPGKTQVVAPSRGGGGFWHGVREVAIVVAAALVISALVRTFLVQAFWVPSGSMEQTLVRHDRILVWKPGVVPRRGDVVVFRDPGGWLADPVTPVGVRGVVQRTGTFLGVLPSSSGDDLVKRIVGVAGDKIECCAPDGRIKRNGVPIDELYLYPGEPTNQLTFSITVPADSLFVMGDHRSDSADSRFHLDQAQGSVPVANVVGIAKVVMWPIGRWARLDSVANQEAAATR